MPNWDEEREEARREERQVEAVDAIVLLFAVTMILGLLGFIFENYVKPWIQL